MRLWDSESIPNSPFAMHSSMEPWHGGVAVTGTQLRRFSPIVASVEGMKDKEMATMDKYKARRKEALDIVLWRLVM